MTPVGCLDCSAMKKPSEQQKTWHTKIFGLQLSAKAAAH